MLFVAGPALAAESQIGGYVERVVVYPGAVHIRAKLDTGAGISSLNAQAPVFFKRGGKDWVRFHVTDRNGKPHLIERPVVDRARVHRSGTDVVVRPIIRLGICLGNLYKVTEVTINDRTGMNYQMLIGRRYLESDVLVDSKKVYRLKPHCPAPSGPVE